MEIKNIEIKHSSFTCFELNENNGLTHIKQLPYLSVVQSVVGSYKIKLGNGTEYETGEGGIFIAPSKVTQRIVHCFNDEKNKFEARYVFLDVLINKKYRLDDVFEFPAVIHSKKINDDFNMLKASDNPCDTMSIMYKMLKHLTEISKPKMLPPKNIYPLIDYIQENYTGKITVGDMAKVLNMSESNLYSVFKKQTGMSPLKYINEYRLSVASGLLIETDLSISRIAEKVGICDQFYFCRMFKEKYLVSPKNYRKMI